MYRESAPQPFWPNLDLYTNASGELIIDVELSQIISQDLDLVVDGCRLLIRGKRLEIETADSYLIREIPRGPFERIVNLPSDFDVGAAKAAYLQGELRIIVPPKGR